MIVTEDTIPAEEDSGIRRFSVTSPDGSRISLQMMQEKEADVEGEIHPPGIRLSRDVVTNEQVTHALLQIAAHTVRFPIGSRLPDDSERWEAK